MSNQPPYSALERQVRIDLACRVIADPQAPAEHVRAAREYLRRDHRMPDVSTIPPALLADLRRVVQAIDDAATQSRDRARIADHRRDGLSAERAPAPGREAPLGERAGDGAE